MTKLVIAIVFLVSIPLGVGIALYQRIPTPLRLIVAICAIWFIAELHSFLTISNSTYSARISYLLTAIEIFLFARFYAMVCKSKGAVKVIKVLGYSGLAVVFFDYIFISTNLNVTSLTIEYILIVCFALYFYYEVITGKNSNEYLILNFTLLFGILSNFPYFFAWEWFRTQNLALLKILADIHIYVNAGCYLVLAYLLWRSSLSYSARSSFPRS